MSDPPPKSVFRGTRSGVSRVDTCVAESPRGFIVEDVPSSEVKLPGATLDGLAAESCFSPPVAVKRTRAHPMRRTARHKRQKEFTSTAAFFGALHAHRVCSLQFLIATACLCHAA